MSVDTNVFASQQGTVTASLADSERAGRELDQPGARTDQFAAAFATGEISWTFPEPWLIFCPIRPKIVFTFCARTSIKSRCTTARNNSLIATLRTGNTPKGMAITFDQHYLLVGCDNAQYVNVYDLPDPAAHAISAYV